MTAIKHDTRHRSAGLRETTFALMLLLFGAGVSAKARGAEGLNTWTPLGPGPIFNGRTVVSGRINIAVSHPTDANVMYVGGDGGVWKTTNYLTTDAGGPTWISLTDNFPSLAISGKSLALYPGNPDMLYAAASGPNGGILKTIDGGSHWEYLFSDVFSAATVSALIIDPTNSNTIYVTVSGTAPSGMPVIGGVYRLHFANTGSTWVNLTSKTAPGSVATDVLIDPTNPKVFYAGLVKATDGSQNGVYRSVDGGETWQLLTNGIYNGSQQVGEWIALAMAPSSPQNVYTTIFQPGNSSTSPKVQRFRTSDSGNSWSMLSLPPAGNDPPQDYRSWHVVLGVDPHSPNIVYANAKEPQFVASTDSGQTWRRLFTGRQFSNCGCIEDVVNAYFDSTGALAYVGDRGIQRVAAPLIPNPTIVSKQGNLGNFLFYNVTLDPRNPQRGFGVSQDQLKVVQFNGEPRWTYASTGTEVGKVLIDPHDPAIVYNLASLQTTFVTRSTDGGSQWTAASNGIDTNEFSLSEQYNQDAYNAFALDEHRPSRLVLGGESVWQTLNGGANWTQISPVLSPTGGSGGGSPTPTPTATPTPANITAVAIAPSQPDTIYAATADGRFWATFDGGITWPERDQGLPVASGNEALDIVIDPAHRNHVFIQMAPSKAAQSRAQTVPVGGAVQGRVWMTNDGGSSWTSLDSGIPTNLLVMSLAVDWRFRPPILYAGTTRGVFFSTDLGMSWALFGQGLPSTIVRGLQILPRHGMLVAATFGRGIYQTQLATPSPTATPASTSSPTPRPHPSARPRLTPAPRP
jgi:photosystem II stability/assembly factor-like uncharacterized protein